MANKSNIVYTVKDYYDAIDKIAPFSKSEAWDNVGILVGSPKTKVKAALVALDVTADVISESKLLNANLIITHHPVIFPSVSRIDGESLLHRLIAENISVISAHTNYDAAEKGVNYELCKILGLENIRIFQNASDAGLCRLGDLESPLQPKELAGLVKQRLNSGMVKYTGGGMITTVAVCGGSGASFWHEAFEQGAQALITAETKHNQLIEAAHVGFTLIDAGHHATEVIAMKPLVEQLSCILTGASITLSQMQKDPTYYL